MGKFYAVRVGRRPGIYTQWSDVQPLVSGFPGAQHKSFGSRSEAEEYLVAGPGASTAGGKRKRDDDGYGTYGPDDDERYASHLRNDRRPVVQSGPPGAHRSCTQATSGVLIAVQTNLAPPPPPAGYATASNHHRPPSNSGGRSRYDPVVEGPLQPIRPGSVYDLEFDGAARGNPGQAGCGALLRYNGEVVCRLRKYMGSRSTNNEAEYTALIEGLKMARRLGVTRVHAKGDSKLVVKQVSGQWNINKEHLRALCDQVHGEVRMLREFEIQHVRREYNADADKLSNDAIDLAYRS